MTDAPTPWRQLTRWQPRIWLGLALVYFALDQARQGGGLDALDLVFLLVRALIWAAVGAGVSFGLLALYRRVSRRALLGVVPVATALAGALWLAVFVAIEGAADPDGFRWLTDWPQEQVFSEYFDFVLALGVWTGAVFSLASHHAATQAALRATQAEAAAAQARLDGLRRQLSPHFLFNSLNTAIALVGQDPDLAESVLTELSSLLRSTLTAAPGELVPLEQELERTRRYVRIEQVRFADDLEFHEHVHPSAQDARVPVLLVHALVENAIKHGQGTPLRVRLSVDADDGRVRIQVTNSGTLGASGAPGTGQGVAILRAQLAAMEPAGTLVLEQVGPDVQCTVRL